LHAQGFGLNEIGACAIARGFANTGAPCKDASMIYWNPAAATTLTGWNVSLGAAGIKINGAFTQDTTGRRWESDTPMATVPTAFIAYHPKASKAAWGIGLYVPYGLTSQWTDDFPGRFQAKKASLSTFYVQPNVSWQLNDMWSIGGGPVFGHSSVELIQSADLSAQVALPPITFGQLGIARNTEFARARLTGSANGFGAQVGIWGQPSPEWSVGARYLAPIVFNYNDADATFTQTPTGLVLGGDLPPTLKAGTPVDQLVASQFASGGRLVSQKVATQITHPAQFQAGLGYSGFKNWLLNADYAWVGWSRFSNLPVDFCGAGSTSCTTSSPRDTILSKSLIESYNNTSAIRLGAEYTMPTRGWKLRGGFAGAASAAPPESVTPLLPEQDRLYYSAGAEIPLFARWFADAAFMHISAPGARGRVIERASTTQTAAQLNTGAYTLSANIFAITLKASY
jgi:long-chain fatty acid transport protein